MRIVAKFGGTSLKDGDRIENAADSIEKAVEEGHEVAVVASAMGSTTDELLDNINFNAEEDDRDEIVSMGERTSVRMLKAALNARGLDAEFYEPGAEGWPVKVDETGSVEEEKTRKKSKVVAKGLDSEVPVITGFLAEDPEGKVTTLGRGGSDTTAVMLGNYMDADRTVIVTDVEGVLTGNPEIVESAHNVGEISVDELRDLSFKGAEVVAPEALPYKEDGMDVTVVHYQNADLLESGTSIEGEFERIINTDEKEFACLTVAGREIRLEPGILAKMTSAMDKEEINIEAASTGMDSVSLFIEEKRAEEANEALHNMVLDKEKISSVTVDDGIGVVRVAGGKLPDRPGVVNDIVTPLADANINIHEIVTSASSVIIFVAYDVREKALEIIQENLEE
ncbi:MAG: aspartate kinase [Nanohaloarchaea archaeon SW_7_46_7]|nr:MAG: aspartate kinase [Nanohaloarchaea archaeon SW_7_46_7]